MSRTCDSIQRFVDGELGRGAADDFRDHLADCRSCQDELRELMLLASLEERIDIRALGPLPVSEPARWRLRWPSRWPRLAVPVAAAAAAAAVTWVLVDQPADAPPDSGAVLADYLSPHLAERRSLEGRIGYPAAGHHREWAPMRSGNAASEAIPATVSVALQQAGDRHGEAAVHLLNGLHRQAAELLARVATLDARSDLALVELLARNHEKALELTAAVLAEKPDHGPALWNRALALRDLELPLVAAETFDRVAELDESGWSDEARRRARELRRAAEAHERSWHRANDSVRAIAAGTRQFDSALVAAHPALFRKWFYRAVHSAASREAVLALEPLAVELERIYGTDAPRRLLRKVAEADFARRRPAAEAYRQLLAGGSAVPARDVADALRAIRRARADDILLGALYLTGQHRDHQAEFRALIESARDPWFDDLGDYLAASELVARGELAHAEAYLSRLLPRCDARAPRGGLCFNFNELLTYVYLRGSRAELAQKLALHTLRLAREHGHWDREPTLLRWVGEATRIAYRLQLSRAYSEEDILRSDDPCVPRRSMLVGLAAGYINNGDAEQAARLMADLPTCPELATGELVGHSLQTAEVYADLASLTAGGMADAAADATYFTRADELLAAIRTSPDARQGDRLVAAEIAGHVELTRHPERGEQLLRAVIAEASRAAQLDEHAHKARTRSYSLLIAHTAARGDHSAALSLFADEAGLAGLSGCVFGASPLLERSRIDIVARDASGVVRGASVEYDARSELAADWVPAGIIAGLRGCKIVDVIARPPLPLSGSLLPADIPWRLRMIRTADAGIDRTAPVSRRIVVHGVEAAPSLELPRLSPWHPRNGTDNLVELRGRQATPDRVLEAMENATDIEFHTHGLVDLGVSDASFLVLSPDADGNYALTAGMIRKASLRGRPIVILGACHAGQAAPYQHRAWSLPLAFLEAGARAVIASPEPLPDSAATDFLAGVRTRIEQGEAPALAVHAEREVWLHRGKGEWTRSILVFE